MRKTLFIILLLGVSQTNLASDLDVQVDCDEGNSLAKKLKKAKPNSIITFTGTCNESALIVEDGISLVGLGNANIILDSATDALVIKGAQRVSISGVVISNAAVAISVLSGSNVTLNEIEIVDSNSFGLLVADNSHTNLSNISIVGSGANGLNVATGSGIVINDSLSISNSAAFGLNAENLSSVFSENANINIHGNGAMGLHAVTASNVFLSNSTLDASENVLRGVSVNSGSSFFAFSTQVIANDTIALDGVAFANAVVDFDRNASLTTLRNRRDGIVIESSTLTSFIFPPVNGPSIESISNGRHGIRIVLGGKLEVKAGSSVTVQKNAANGLFIDDGSAANLRNANVTMNTGADLSLSFASRVDSVSANTIDTIHCDSTSIMRGEHNCP